MLDRAISTSTRNDNEATQVPSLLEAVAAAVDNQDRDHARSGVDTAVDTRPVTYQAVLPLSRPTVQAIAAHLRDHRAHLGTRTGRRALGCFAQAVMFARWLIDQTRIVQLAVDNAVSLRTAYRYVHEVLDVLGQKAPDLRAALAAAREAGHEHVAIDGTLIETDRCSIPGPTSRKKRNGEQSSRKVDLWWSGKHHCHGGNVQVITAPDGWPIWTSPVRPGREHDITCARTHNDLLQALADFSDDEHQVLADLGYEGENGTLVCAVKAPTDGSGLPEDVAEANKAHNARRAPAERGNALLKYFKGLRRVSLCPTRIGTIVAAALVVLHLEHHHTV
ncbi:DDE superfamily endonuclease [Quadrisphaera granulorum]|uniref:DDE superfamily endonuclease n=1 Tax=Quadrisphaera granulorum TaxID=317664 RepID=A0A315Z720_9ACTN|nr:DDE superfamily endonuclease [Quadrisphaera granulorum]SZE99244.1 DDE superfamily endonuclease [Quadrisphaera granulorum]